jgi:hypothetical protein
LSQKQQKTLLKMLASTIQFSKYGQAYRPNSPLPSDNPSKGKTHPLKNHHQEFGESRPQPHSYTRSAKIRCSSDPEKPVHLSEEIRPDSSGPNSAPRPFTQPHSRSTLTLRREFAVLARSVVIPA